MNENLLGHPLPKFYGATTIGERGQLVIPSEARKDFKMTPSTKVLVFSGPGRDSMVLVKAEAVTEFLSRATKMLSGLEEVLNGEPDDSG